MRGRLEDLTGQTYGNIKALSSAGQNGNGNYLWNCICVICGKEKQLITGSVKASKKYKDTKTCRCWKNAACKKPEYKVWKALKNRCLNNDCSVYYKYGGRGITVYKPWITSFQTFYAYVGPRPSSKHSLDRINNDGNYEPGNLRWATSTEQCRNRRSNTKLVYKNETRLLAEWVQIKGIARDTIMRRIKKLGWSVEKALDTPVKKRAA